MIFEGRSVVLPCGMNAVPAEPVPCGACSFDFKKKGQPKETNRKKRGRSENPQVCPVVSECFGLAQIFGLCRASSAALAIMGRRFDQFNICLRVIDLEFSLHMGTECFLLFIGHGNMPPLTLLIFIGVVTACTEIRSQPVSEA
jgi:hypothetical protein